MAQFFSFGGNIVFDIQWETTMENGASATENCHHVFLINGRRLWPPQIREFSEFLQIPRYERCRSFPSPQCIILLSSVSDPWEAVHCVEPWLQIVTVTLMSPSFCHLSLNCVDFTFHFSVRSLQHFSIHTYILCKQQKWQCGVHWHRKWLSFYGWPCSDCTQQVNIHIFYLRNTCNLEWSLVTALFSSAKCIRRLFCSCVYALHIL